MGDDGKGVRFVARKILERHHQRTLSPIWLSSWHPSFADGSASLAVMTREFTTGNLNSVC